MKLETMASSSSSSSSAHGVYALAPVEVDKPPKKPQQIEAVLASRVAWAELAPLVFVGASDATLHGFVPAASGSAASLAFLRWHSSYRRVFHASACFLDAWGVYATLLDARLTLYALPLHANPFLEGNAAPAPHAARDAMVTVDETKGALLFAAHEDARALVCLTKQNALKIFDWTAARALELRGSLELPAVLAATKLLSPAASLPVQKMLLLGEFHVLLLFKKEWCVVNVDSGRVLELTAASAAAASSLVQLDAISCAALLPPSPAASRTGGALVAARTRDAFIAGKHIAVRVAVVSTQPAGAAYTAGDGFKVAVERVLEYNVAPKSAFLHHPFVLLDMQDRLAVYSAATMKPVDGGAALPVKGQYGGCVAVPVPSAAAASAPLARELLARGLPVSFLSVAAPFSVQLLQMAPVATLLEQHVAAGRLEDAVLLAELCPEEVALNDDEKKELFTDYALRLFREQHAFAKAMEYFWRARADVEDVLALFPTDLLPRVSVVRGTQSKRKEAARAPLGLQGDALVQSLLALIEFLTKSRDALAPPSSSSYSSSPSPSPHAQQRLQLLDTVLLKCLVLIAEQPDHAAAAQRQRLSYQIFELVRSPNWCEVGETEVFLRAHNQVDTLLGFYASRKLHRKALELLEDLERSAAAAPPCPPTAATACPALPQAKAALRTPADYWERTAQYLQRLGQKKAELVFEFSRRVIYADPVLGLSIFTHREDEIEDGDHDIDPALIVHHLKSCPVQPPAGDDDDANDATELPMSDSRFLAIEYITHVILHDRVAVAPRLHDDAVYLLLDAVHAELQGNTATTSSRLAPRVASQRGLLGQLRRKLLAFLECPGAQYHPERMLSRTPHEMVDERAALLSRLGRHHEVLQLYALQLRDAALAEAYCNKCFESKQADSSIYSTLLRLYLRPARSISATSVVQSSASSSSPPKPLWQRATSLQLPPSSGGQPVAGGGSTISLSSSPTEAVSAAINILNKYAERIDVPTALDLLPPDVPVAALALFFRRVLERQVERFRNGQIKMQLAKMENFKVREKLTVKRKDSVTVWSSHCCYVCGKKLGVGTFVRLPQTSSGTLTLVHYACQPAARLGHGNALV